MASSPKGVAALPAPKKFAAKFSVIGAIASPALGKSRLRGFLIARESASISPALRAMPISPIHSIYAPARERESVTALAAPSVSASSTAAMLPFAAPHIIAAAIIAAKT